MAPLTVWAAHSSAVAISSMVAPPGARNISIRASCLVPFRRWTGAVATSAGVVVASGSVIPSVFCASGVARRVAKTVALQSAMYHIECRGFLCNEQHGAATAQLIGDDVGDRLALAGAWWPDQHEITAFRSCENGRKL